LSWCVGERAAKKKALCTEIQSAFLIFGGTSGGRTHDKRIKSPLLYQLSYGPNEALDYRVKSAPFQAAFEIQDTRGFPV
jgi:hypothetical protein